MWVVLSTLLFVTVFELSKYGGENVRFCFCSFFYFISVHCSKKSFFFVVWFSMYAIVFNCVVFIYLLDLIFHCKRCKSQYLWLINLFMAILKLTLSFRYVFASVRVFSQQTVWKWNMSAIYVCIFNHVLCWFFFLLIFNNFKNKIICIHQMYSINFIVSFLFFSLSFDDFVF